MSSQPPYEYDPQHPVNPISGAHDSYGQDHPTYPTPGYTPPQSYTPQPDPTPTMPGHGYHSSPSYPIQPPTYPQQHTYPQQPAYPPPPPSYSQPLYPGAMPSMPLPPGQPGMPPYYPNMQPAMPSVPMYGAPVMVSVRLPVVDPGAGQATTSLILGIIGLSFSVLSLMAPPSIACCGSIAFILGILGIIFGAIGRRSVTRKGQATAGLVTSILAVALPIVVFIFVAIASASSSLIR